MDNPDPLTAEEIDILSDPAKSFEDATKALQAASGAQQARDEGTFEKSLRYKVTLDVFEKRGVATPLWADLALLLNCEYQLYLLNKDTLLRLNPFLSHWVETIQRLSVLPPKPSSSTHFRETQATDSLTYAEICTTRIELIKRLLQASDQAQVSPFSPIALHDSHVDKRVVVPLDILLYIEMLEEEGIYEKLPVDKATTKPYEVQHENANSSNSSYLEPSSKQDWKQSILARLETDRESALSDLIRLPLELASLDFLTTLLQNQTLQRLDIDPSPVIHDFLQHSLRLIEHMGQPVGSNSMDYTSSFNNRMNGMGDGADEDIGHGRDAQTRAVQLLLLFLRNLIRKSLVSLDAIYFEIQEICVRYVWIKEVREFRSFVQLGTASEQMS